MNLKDIRKSIARNLELLSSDNKTILNGNITKAGLDDEINRVYEYIYNILCAKSPDDFTVQVKTYTHRAFFTVASVDIPNKTISSVEGVFGTIDEGNQIQNPTKSGFLTIETVINSNQVKVIETPLASWVEDTAYILTPTFVIQDNLEGLKELTRFQIKQTATETTYQSAEKLSVGNFVDKKNMETYIDFGKYYYCVGEIKVNDLYQRCITYLPKPKNYNGEVNIFFTKNPRRLDQDNLEPVLDHIGISEPIINGVTAWGLKKMNDVGKASQYEELNQSLGGIVPKGLTALLRAYKPNRDGGIKYKGFR